MAQIPATRGQSLLRLRDPRDAAAWTEFVELYTPLVYGYVRKQGLQDADAADLSQDVLISVARANGPTRLRPAARRLPQLAVHHRRNKLSDCGPRRVAGAIRTGQASSNSCRLRGRGSGLGPRLAAAHSLPGRANRPNAT